MNIIAEVPWSYVLFDDGHNWILTCLIGGVVEIDVSITLTQEERQLVSANPQFIEQVLRELKNDRAAFSEREINPPVWPS